MANANLGKAKAGKKDEFYTQYCDIQQEMNAYVEYNPDVFRDKTILLPCDDPEWSNFTKFFALNFEKYGIKKLISTSYAPESKKIKAWQPTLFETDNPRFDADKSKTNGKIFVLDRDLNGDGRININDLQWEYLEGDGDFRSREVCALRDEADIIITNPPFSLFRKFIAWIMEAEKTFVIIGNQNAITYKEVFPLIKDNKMWYGKGFKGGAGHFISNYEDVATASNHKKGMIRVSGVVWLTNLDHGKRHHPLDLMTMEDNIMFSKHKEVKGMEYCHYDNFDAIEVPFSDAIPIDYEGMMGVPITFLDKYCPEQFEILGITKTWFGMANKVYPEQIQVDKKGKEKRVTKLNDGPVIKVQSIPPKTYYKVNDNIFIQKYARILIRKKQ